MAHEASPALSGTMSRGYDRSAERTRLAGWPEVSEPKLLRVAAICALMGTLLTIAAGLGFGDLTREMRAEPVLEAIGIQSPGTWGLVHLGFVLGAVLWVVALVSLSASRTLGPGTGLAWIASAVLIIGASIQAVNSFVAGFGLGTLAEAWAQALPENRDQLRFAADAILPVLGGTWTGVITLFHGLPFVLFGLAVVRSRVYPAWLGWVAVVGGLGSFAIGSAMMLDTDTGPGRAFVPFALLVSVFMAVLGWRLWMRAEAEDRDLDRTPARATTYDRTTRTSLEEEEPSRG